MLDKNLAADMIKAHGANKVLFGTDWPWFSQTKTLKLLEDLPISEEDKENIKHKNAEKILGI